ncbi:MAG TPA: molybdopterin oxidoreductase [Bdellovibrionota bacterium]|jgi:hypothetical protein
MKVDAKKFEPSSGTNSLVMGMMALGLVTFAAGLFTNATRVWQAFLVYHCLAMGLAIGSLFFLVIHYLASAGWNVAVRRVTESFASYFFVAALFNVVLLFGTGKIYPWTNHAFMESEHVLHGKIGYFGTLFFSARVLVFSAVVCFFAWQILGNSTRQDEEGGTALWSRQRPLSAVFLVLFAPLMTMFSVDVIKSLDPKWFSTMFGVYVFTGFVQASVAAVIVAVTMLKKSGYLKEVTADHYHDLGKYLFGFTIFWAYIGVSQYLLIWYANLPEETTYYIQRQHPGWVWFSMLLPTVRFVLPFLLLLPRMAKRTPSYLVKVAYLVLFGAWLDLYWMIMPNFSPSRFGISVWDVGMAVGFAGFVAFAVRKFLSQHNTIPVKDPFVHETLHHHVY